VREKEALAEFAAAVRVKLRFFDELEAVQVGGGLLWLHNLLTITEQS